MIYNDRQREKLERLNLRLQKIGFRFKGTQKGFGQMGIITTNDKPVPDTEYWLVDFIEGKITGAYIVKALLGNTTPYIVAGAAALKKQKNMQSVENDEPLLCEHWSDLNDAALEAVRALAEISK